LTLGVALLLLFQMRVFRNPKLSHFLEWGLAVAFGIYTYISIRPWVLFLFTVTILWILFRHRKDKNRWALWPVLILFATGYFLFFLDKLLYVFHANKVSELWGSHFTSFVMIQVVFLVLLVFFYKTSAAKEREMTSLAMGLMLAGFLVYPLAMDPGISAKIRDISILPKNPGAWFNPALFNQIKEGVSSTVAAMFSGGPDRADMNVVNDAFFDYHAVVWVILGLVFAAARPSWLKCFFVLCAIVGVVPHVMTSDPQSAKLLGSMPPLLLLSALAVDQWIEGAVSSRGILRWLGVGLALVVVAFWGWEANGTYQRVYGEWWKITSPDVFVSRQLKKDLPTHRVYLAFYNGMGFFSTAVEGVLNYGTPVYACGDTNVIDVLPGAPRTDVALIVFAQDQPVLDRVKKEFPKAQWNPCWQYYQTPGVGNPFMYDIWIPAAQIPDKPGKMFMFHTVPKPGWLRRIYLSPVGLANGLIRYESIVPALNPLPVEAGANSVSCENEWDAPADGHYTFSVSSQDVIKLLVDGKAVLDIKPYGSAT
ncbi:MAG TPA: hypothetical protein VJ873_06985, partial [bacterium]|nr:hypothetical protein [bacterium]